MTKYILNKCFWMLIFMKVELEDIICITDTALTIRGSRRRITVPSEVVEILKLKDGDKLHWIVFKNGNIQIQHVNKK